MLVSELIDANEELETVWQLIYRGHAPDADLPWLRTYIGKALKLDDDKVDAALAQAPFALFDFADQGKARQHQMALAKAGSNCSLQPVWKLQSWVLPHDLPSQFTTRVQRAAAADRGEAVALLRMPGQPGRHCLQQHCAERLSMQYQVLNHGDILIWPGSGDCSSREDGLGDQLQNVMAACPGETSAKAVIANCPEDGYTLAEVLRGLEQRLEQGESKAEKAAIEEVSFPREEWLLAGTAWLEMVRHGSPEALEEHCDDSQCAELRRSWPVFAPEPSAAAGPPRERILEQYAAAAELRQKHRERVATGIAGMDELPTLPNVAVEACRLAQSPDSTADELSEIIGRDPSLSGRMLAAVNSSAFGLSSRVDSIQHALVILGFKQVTNLVLRLGAKPMFRALPNELGQNLWQHSAKAAEIAAKLAERVTGLVPATAYTSALLHDVGKICLYACEEKVMQHLQGDAQEIGLPVFELERQRLGLDHAMVGAVLLRRWGLPEVLCKAVEQHHGPLPHQSSISELAGVIALSDHIAHRLDGSEAHGDGLRLRRAHEVALQDSFGRLSPELLDLLAEDVFETAIPFDDDF